MSPDATPFVTLAAAAGSSTDEVVVERCFLEDAGVIRSDESIMTRTEMSRNGFKMHTRDVRGPLSR